MILLGILLITLFIAGLWLALSHLGFASQLPWLAAHIVSAALAYALFALAVGCAWVFIRREKDLRLSTTVKPSRVPAVPLLTLERWMFLSIYAGFALLSVSLLVGAYSGSSGFIVRIGHKTIFALLAWLSFGVLIAGRLWFGWRGRQAVRFVYLGSAFLLLAYVGTWFVLEVILQR